jgi:hypothetical protein
MGGRDLNWFNDKDDDISRLLYVRPLEVGGKMAVVGDLNPQLGSCQIRFAVAVNTHVEC